MYEIFEKLLIKKGVKTSAVSQATGIPASTFSDWKSGRSKPKQEKLKKIADYFNVSLGYLMGTEEEKEKEECIKVIDEDNNIVVLDDETLEVIDSLRTRPEMKILFSVSKKATKEDIIKAVKIIEALREEEE